MLHLPPKPASFHSVMRKNSSGDFQNCPPDFKCILSRAMCSLLCCHTPFWQMLAPQPDLEPVSPSEAEGKAFIDLASLSTLVKAQRLQVCGEPAGGKELCMQSGNQISASRSLTISCVIWGKSLSVSGVPF